ncbi:MAG: M3 family oligoendopeptidase [Chitinophagales bacterium]
MTDKIIERKPRTFLPESFKVATWEELAPYYDQLLARPIESVEDLLQWLKDRSELDAVVSEDYCWRHINKTRDTTNSEFEEHYNYFVKNIEPSRMTASNQLDKKFSHSRFKDALDNDRFLIYKRNKENDISLFREENIPLQVEIQQTANKYYSIAGKMTIEHDDKELTMQQAGALFESKDRELRETIFHKSNERRLEDQTALHELFDELLAKRHQVALNAGFENYRDYKLQAMGRFDYGVKECEQFHDSVEETLIPILDELYQHRKNVLGVKTLKPYDTSINLGDKEVPVPFDGTDDLVDKTITCLNEIDPYFAECLSIMKNMNHLDLDSRKGKAPGGYNCPLAEIGVPFIFMNSANTAQDIRTMIHEGGHAVHSFLMNDLEYDFDKHLTSEAAELASMSMEMFALDQYDTFFQSEEDRHNAIYNFLEDVIIKLPWIALVDKFQHWLYTNPNHTHEERNAKWLELHKRFSSNVVDWSDYEAYEENLWQKQLHIFMVPFYYIEYGIAQLGAIGLWKNFKDHPKATIESYKKALKLGYTKPLSEMYETAGIPFDFSKAHIKSLGEFVKSQLN